MTEVREAKSPGSTAIKLSAKIRWSRLRRYDICGTRLCSPLKKPRLFFVAVEELFDIIHATHTMGHLGRNRMMYELKKNYKNVTYEAVNIYLKLCRICTEKKDNKQKECVVKPIVEKTFNDRCQVDLIDMQSCPDGEWRFIFVYQDHLTKFVQIKPLKTKRAEEVAAALVEVFHTFGAPCILQSDNGREFCNAVIEKLVAQWPHVRLVHGAPRHSQSQGSVERANRDIKQMLATWVATQEEGERRWSTGLSTVQFNYNTAFHSSIGQSPYECVFGMQAKRGLATLARVHDLSGVETEEQLLAVNNTAATATSNTTEDHHDGNDRRMDVDDHEDGDISSDNNVEDDRRRAHALAGHYLKKQATRMLRKTRAAFTPAVNDTVRVFVPALDRGPLDARNLLACVLEVRHTSSGEESATTDGATSTVQIRVGTPHGELDRWLSPNQFERVEHPMVPPESVRQGKQLSIRQAVVAHSQFGGQGMSRCHCKQQCATAKCSCRRSGVLCTVRCHRTGTCTNR